MRTVKGFTRGLAFGALSAFLFGCVGRKTPTVRPPLSPAPRTAHTASAARFADADGLTPLGADVVEHADFFTHADTVPHEALRDSALVLLAERRFAELEGVLTRLTAPLALYLDRAVLDTATSLYGAMRAKAFRWWAFIEAQGEAERQAALGGWSRVPAVARGEKLVRGDTGYAFVVLKCRLAEEGYRAGRLSARFDDSLAVALAAYQKRHGLGADSVYGPFTASDLNVSARRRLRWFAFQKRLAGRSSVEHDTGFNFRVNLPEFILEVRDGERVLRRHRVAVGIASDTNRTRTMDETMRFVVVNPRWNVPDRILENELSEEIYDAGGVEEFLADGRYEVKATEDRVWLQENNRRMTALGRVKFLFPNRHDIYLHDTPLRSVFVGARRAVSHGCIRVDSALALAEFLLRRQFGPERGERIFRNALNATEVRDDERVRKEVWITLPKRFPVHVVYEPLTVGADSQVVLLPDVYRAIR